MRDAAWLTGAGLAIGLPITLLLGRAMSRGLLFGIRGYDPLVCVSAPDRAWLGFDDRQLSSSAARRSA